MDALELMLRRSQYICVLVLVDARFSILKKKNRGQPNEERRGFGLENIWKKREKYGQFHILFFELSLSDQTESTSFDISGWVQNEIVDMPDNPGWTRTNLENRECSYFPATHPRFLRWSAIIPDKSKLKFVPSETLAMDFAHYQSPINCWAPVPLSRKFQFLAHFPFPAKFIGRIWVWLVAIIRYIGDGQRKVKSPIVLDFPDIWKPGFISRPSLILNNKKLNTVICVLILVSSIKFLDLTFHRASWCRSLFFNKL